MLYEVITYWENGQWVITEPHEIHKPLNYPEIGPKESYVIYHEELESLVKNFPTLKRARFWMTFGQEYLTHLRVITSYSIHYTKLYDTNTNFSPCSWCNGIVNNRAFYSVKGCWFVIFVDDTHVITSYSIHYTKLYEDLRNL